jgi:hypothetical protein
MYSTLLVVDNFITNADEVRKQALQFDYPDLKGQFPGRNSYQRSSITGLHEEVSRLLGEPLVPIDPPQSHGKFRMTLATDAGRGKVHIDHSHWSGILYLSRPEDCRGGTEFFRHRRTGLDRMPLDPSELAAAGYATFDEAHRDLIEIDGTDETAWETIMQVPMRFNRLVLLRPWLFHTAGPGFGDAPENARLVHLMFFNRASRPTG